LFQLDLLRITERDIASNAEIDEKISAVQVGTMLEISINELPGL
jgi:hypothetical protein